MTTSLIIIDDGTLETMARAMEPLVSDDMAEPFKSAWLADLASAAINALTDAGYAIVPIAPTKQMIAAGIDAAEDVEDWTQDTNHSYRVDRASDYPFPVYRAMITAAHPIESGEGKA